MDITITNLTKVYGIKTILNIKELYLRKHKIHGIIGPNGAGKSTLLKIIAGLDTVTKGRILYNNNNFNQDLIKKITYISQNPYLLDTTVYENIAYPLRIRKWDNKLIDYKVQEIINEFKLEELINRNAKTLSGGEGQKVALSRALIFNPDLLLLDEPTSNIDVQTIDLIEKILISRNKLNNITIVIISHNIKQIERISDNIIFMDKGKTTKYDAIKLMFNDTKNIP